MSILSNRLNRFKPSLTVKISQKARELQSKGKEIISLSSGEPDFDTPDHIKEEGVKAINDGFTKYTSVDGVLSLKESIQKKFKIENRLNYSTNQITVGVGGKHVIYNLFMSTVDEDDEVIIPAPYWVSYPDIVSLCNGKPILLDTLPENKFKITPDELEKKITRKTKWLVINSPSNPTGSCYSEDELYEISKVLMKYENVHILSDDIYEHLIYENIKFYNILNVEPKLYNNTFIVNGVSKAFSMTGWRIGYGAGSEDIIKSIQKIQSQSTTNPTSISQMAAMKALDSEKMFLSDWIIKFKERRDFVVEKFNHISGLRCIKPEGAFYVFVSCEGLINKITPSGEKIGNDIDFASYLLESQGVAVVPGSAFGKSPYFRISYAASMELLVKACDRISKAVNNLSEK
jgi:aspartate aminotransferase